MRISDWSSDVCSSDLLEPAERVLGMHRDDERVLGKIGEINGRLLERGRSAEETDIDFSVRDGRYLLLRRHLAKGYRHERITRPKRSEERRVGKECVSTCRSRCERYH